nr:MAG TPA: hypothetical protein [Caudoviricetes sp.]
MEAINTDFSALLPFIEQNDFVEYQGSLYYIGNKTPEEAQKQYDITLELDEMETTPYINSRRNVGSVHLKSQPYSLELTNEEIANKAYSLDGVRIVKSDDGILPDSDYIVLKRLKHIPSDYPENKPPHVLWDEATKAYYLMSNTDTSIDVEPIIVPADYHVISSDISAQEPMCSTLVTREPGWADVFTLKNFRYDPTNLQMLDIICEEYLRLPHKDPIYINFIHDTYTHDRTDIIRLNLLVAKVKLDPSADNRQALKTHIKFICDKFEAYRQQCQKENS